MWQNVIIAALLVAVAGGIIFYLIRAKRRGQNCIGCPNSKECKGKCSGSCGKND